MIAVIFEVRPKEGQTQEYLDLAASLRPLLENIDGFLSIERFESLYEPGKILSLSFWRDEKAVEEWRKLEAHREVQAQGRAEVFKDYRLRVASVLRDYGMFEREQAPLDSRQFHDGD
jgi:heme-degrading monooxygenase HmoA